MINFTTLARMKLFRKRYYKALKHGCEEDKYTPDLDMLPTITATAGIIGTVLILLVPIGPK